jgi:hypothetical protein
VCLYMKHIDWLLNRSNDLLHKYSMRFFVFIYLSFSMLLFVCNVRLGWRLCEIHIMKKRNLRGNDLNENRLSTWYFDLLIIHFAHNNIPNSTNNFWYNNLSAFFFLPPLHNKYYLLTSVRHTHESEVKWKNHIALLHIVTAK